MVSIKLRVSKPLDSASCLVVPVYFILGAYFLSFPSLPFFLHLYRFIGRASIFKIFQLCNNWVRQILVRINSGDSLIGRNLKNKYLKVKFTFKLKIKYGTYFIISNLYIMIVCHLLESRVFLTSFT